MNITKQEQQVFQCQNCSYTCRLNIQLKNHIKRHHTHGKYSCEECDYNTNLVASLWEHVAQEHVQEKQSNSLLMALVAELNGNVLVEIGTLKKDTKEAFLQLASAVDDSLSNVRKDLSDDKFNLSQSVEKLQSKVKAVVNIGSKKVEQQKRVCCPFCDLESENTEGLKKHIENIHWKKDLATENEQINSQGDQREQNDNDPFNCEKCTSVFNTYQELEIHFQSVHTSQESEFQCTCCGRISENESDLKDHMIEEHGDLVILHTMGSQVDNMFENFPTLPGPYQEEHLKAEH